jgi:16S rRNA (guanine1207-N2)-methyltransferase
VSDYYARHEFDAVIAGSTIRVVTKAGLSHEGDVSPASRLLAEAAVAAEARILVLGGGHGALAVALGRRASAGWIDVLDVHVGVLDVTQATLTLNRVTNAAVLRSLSVLPDAAGSYDVVVMETPPNRALARRWLVEALGALRDGGILYLAGANNEGIQSIIADAGTLFGNITQLGFKAKHRIARAQKDGDAARAAWAAEPGIAPGTFAQVELRLVDGPLSLYTLPGVFAYDRLDPGTALLLHHMSVPQGARVLDAGCGIGILGIAASRRGAGSVDLIDASLLAVATTAKNIVATSTPHARVLASDAFQAVADERYDLIVSNPPFHAGKGVTYDVAHTFIAHGRQLLRSGGRIILVANRFLAYDAILRQHYRRVERLVESAGFHVLLGEA